MKQLARCREKSPSAFSVIYPPDTGLRADLFRRRKNELWPQEFGREARPWLGAVGTPAAGAPGVPRRVPPLVQAHAAPHVATCDRRSIDTNGLQLKAVYNSTKIYTRQSNCIAWDEIQIWISPSIFCTISVRVHWRLFLKKNMNEPLHFWKV